MDCDPDPDYYRWLRCYKAQSLFLLGDSQEAAALACKQVDRFGTTSHRFGLPMALLRAGEFLTANDPNGADSALTEALSLYKQNGQEGFVVDALRLQSTLRSVQNRTDEAVELAESAIAECRKGPREAEGLGDKHHLLQVLMWQVELSLRINQEDSAINAHRESRGLLETHESPHLYRKWISNESRFRVPTTLVAER